MAAVARAPTPAAPSEGRITALGSPPSPKSRTPRARSWRNAPPVRIWKRYFPPVRLVWIFLVLLVWNADGFVSRAVAWPLLVLPIVAVVADLGFQFARFPKLRIPDAAIANGLFLSVILWPATVSLELVAVVVAMIGIRHVLRVGGHPLLNPAAVGVSLAAVVFALPQPWHVGLTLNDSILIAVLGLVLWSRAWHTWRLWAVYFVVNIVATLLLADYLAGPRVLALVVQTSVLGAAPVFYGFFMVTEPRTAPSRRPAMLLYGALVGLSAALLPIVFAEDLTLSALGVLTPYLALYIGNVITVALPSARGVRRPAPAVDRPRGLPSPTDRGVGDRAA